MHVRLVVALSMSRGLEDDAVPTVLVVKSVIVSEFVFYCLVVNMHSSATLNVCACTKPMPCAPTVDLLETLFICA